VLVLTRLSGQGLWINGGHYTFLFNGDTVTVRHHGLSLVYKLSSAVDCNGCTITFKKALGAQWALYCDAPRDIVIMRSELML
jgi:hypothetical protein